MFKSLNRNPRKHNSTCIHSACTSLIGAMSVLTASSSVAMAEVPAWQLGKELRWALGFDAMDMATLGVSNEAYETIVTSANSYCQSHTQDVQNPLATLRQARATFFRLLEVNNDTEASEQAIAAAKTEINSIVVSIQETFSSLTTTLHAPLSPTAQGLQLQLATHRLIDPFTAALDLNPSQLTEITAAQHLRDRSRLHCITRALPSIVQVADDIHETAIAGILNEGQRQARAALVASVNERILSFSQIDEQHP